MADPRMSAQGNTIGSLSAADASAKYELLLHSLTHEDTCSNYSRHQLVLEQWARDFSEGFFIRDLPYVGRVLDVLRERLALHESMFRPVTMSVLKIAALPLFETKANERLRPASVAIIKNYLRGLTLFWSTSTTPDQALNSEVIKCFRSITNGGLDPSILKVDIKDKLWENDGFRVQVTDKSYLQTQLRESGTVSVLLSQFLDSAEGFETEFDVHQSYLQEQETQQKEKMRLSESSTQGQYNGSSAMDDDSDDDGPQTQTAASNTQTGAGEGGEALAGTVAIGAPVPSKEALGDYQELLQQGRSLMMELTKDVTTAALLAEMGICDGVIRLLRIAAITTCRDPQVSFTIDLIWTVLDAYLSQAPPAGSLPAVGPASQHPSPSPRQMSLDQGPDQGPGSIDENIDIDIATGVIPPGPRTLEQLTSKKIMNFERAMHVLLDIFLQLLHEGYRMADKECRNEVLVVISIIATFNAHTPLSLPAWDAPQEHVMGSANAFSTFMSTGTLNALITYSCVVEMGSTPKSWPFYSMPIAKMRNYGSVHDIDLQLKRGMWLAISEVLASDDTDAILAVASSPLMENLLGYLEFDSFASQGQNQGQTQTQEAGGNNQATNGNGNGNGNVSPSMGPPTLSPGRTTSNSTGGGSPRVLSNQTQTEYMDGQNQGQNLAPPVRSPGHAFMSQLPQNQLLELQVQAAMFLSENAPKMLGEWLRIQGTVRFLDIAHKYSRSQVPEHKQMVYSCLLLLNRCMVLSIEVRAILEQENAIETFLTQFECTDEEDTRTLVSRLISILCSGGNEVCQSQLREQQGIGLLIGVVGNYAEHRRTQIGRIAGLHLNAVNESDDVSGSAEDPDGGSVSILMVAILDCLQHSIVGNKKSEVVFATEEGIDALLNLLEVSQLIARVQVLRLLSDILENKKMLSFLNAWRSPKTMRAAAAMVAHCWLDEEARLEVKRDQGILNNIYDPLQCHNWPEDIVSQSAGESLSSGGSLGGMSMKSLAVTRLSEAISQARVVNGLVPGQVRSQVLKKDTRGIVARILALVGVVDSYNRNPPGSTQGGVGYLSLYENIDIDIGTCDGLGLGEGSNILLGEGGSVAFVMPDGRPLEQPVASNSATNSVTGSAAGMVGGGGGGHDVGVGVPSNDAAGLGLGLIIDDPAAAYNANKGVGVDDANQGGGSLVHCLWAVQINPRHCN